MILCPNCQHHEIAGALFCSECGAQLVFAESLSTQTIARGEADTGAFVQNTPNVPPPSPPQVAVDALISLFLMESGKVVPLSGRSEFTLGRITEGQPILPDVDLSPYEAYSQGVSRLHAAIKIVNQRVVVVDLGSSNGTRVNGQKIVPNVDFPINHGDVVALGRLRIQVLLKR